MAKVTAPMFSLGARGSLAKTLVFSVWKGVAYARQHVTPSNPNTDAQQAVRGIMGNVVKSWQTTSADDRVSWRVTAGLDSRPLSGFNAFTSNLAAEGQDAADAPYGCAIADASAGDNLVINCNARNLDDQGVDNSLTLKLHYGSNPRLLSGSADMAWSTDHYTVSNDMGGAATGYCRVYDSIAERYITGHFAYAVPGA
jgi:hypothetical protein